jgi:hypothetical protein
MALTGLVTPGGSALIDLDGEWLVTGEEEPPPPPPPVEQIVPVGTAMG